MTTAKRMRLLLLAGALAVPAAAQQGTIEVQPLEPLDPGESQSGDGVSVRSLDPLDEAEEGGFVRLPAPGGDEGDLFSEGFDEGAFGESDGGGDAGAGGEQTAAPASPSVPEGQVTEDGLWAIEEEDSLLGSPDQSGSGWMEPAPGAGFGAEGEGTAALIEGGEDDEPRFLVAPSTGGGLFGPNRPRPLPQTSTMATEGAEIRELDKMTGATRTVTIKAGEERQIGRLRVLLEGCHMPREGGAQGTRAFLRVWDPLSDTEAPVFSGWMFAESPALSALDHPRYDLWVLGCMTNQAADAEEGEEPGEG
ncbi:MAG TPA: DUF2155 domain-containing protein [Thermohalobaculum sp.]|nr:DUF2155 domain-containing protein [Thermohalobaculum sp.]